MAIVTSMFWTPNTTEAGGGLRENLTAFRNVAREVGMTSDVVSLVPGGGGVQGEMGILTEFSSPEEYVAALDSPPDPKIVKNQQNLKSSDSKPVRTSTLMEIPGTEVVRSDLPQGLMNVSVIAPIPGKAAEAIADVRKSQEIMGKLGIKVRAMQAFLSDPAGVLIFAQFYESAAEWGVGVNALTESAEWSKHFANAHENRHIVRASAWAIAP